MNRPKEEGDDEETDVEESRLWKHLCRIPVPIAAGQQCNSFTYKEHLELLCEGKLGK